MNGEAKALTVPAQIRGSSTFIPLRFVGEALGANVSFSSGVITITSAAPRATTTVHFIDVGQGDSILIMTPEKAVLIDGGERDKGDEVVSYLRAQGVTSLDLLIATHPHSDHIGGLPEVIEPFPVGRVLDSGYPHTTDTYISYLQLIEHKEIPFAKASNETIDMGDSSWLEIYAPIGTYDDMNNYSVVSKLVVGEVSVLLTGDMEAVAEADLLAAHDLDADVLKVGHHGSNSSSSEAFLAEVTPDDAVISVGDGNSYGHPGSDAVARLEEAGVESLYRTDLHGDVVMEKDGVDCSFVIEEEVNQPTEPTGMLAVAATMSDATPAQNSTISASVIKGGVPLKMARVTISCAYKSTTSVYSGATDAAGVARIPFKIGRASKGYRVAVTVTVEHDGETAKTTTSFTPR